MRWVGSRWQVAALNRSDEKVTSEHGLQGGEVSASNSSIKAEAGAYLVSLRTEAQVGLELSRGAQCLGMRQRPGRALGPSGFPSEGPGSHGRIWSKAVPAAHFLGACMEAERPGQPKDEGANKTDIEGAFSLLFAHIQVTIE